MKDLIKRVEKYIKGNLSKKRLHHSVCVAKKCAEIAKLLKLDEDKAYLIGLGHDITKEWSCHKHRKYIKKYYKRVEKTDRLLHSISGSLFLKEKFKIKDGTVLKAVLYHTDPNTKSDVYTKILFCSDWISDDRDNPMSKKLKKIYKNNPENIDLLFKECVFGSIMYSLENGNKILPRTVQVWNNAI